MRVFFRLWRSFSGREIKGITVCIFLSLILILLRENHYYFNKNDIKINDSVYKQVVSIKSTQNSKNILSIKNDEIYKDKKKYFFDPNTLKVEDWQKLGFSKRQSEVIINYKNKISGFKKKEDLKNIYVISDQKYNELEPYINIKSNKVNINNNDKHISKANNTLKQDEVFILDINTADSASFEKLKGIGPVLASRIVKYRNRLGGFYSINQLHEVYGLDSILIDNLKKNLTVNTQLVIKVDLNTANYAALRRYPYLNNEEINRILNYRKQNNKFLTTQDLVNKDVISMEKYDKIKYYIEVK